MITLAESVIGENRGSVDNLQSTLYTQLVATYKWLNDRADETHKCLASSYPNFCRRPVFLNVDMPRERWRFVSASQLCFGQSRDALNGKLFSPRHSLAPYEKLLLGCGAQKIDPFAGNQDTISYPEQAIRKSFNELRLQCLLLDVQLVSSREGSSADASDLKAHRAFLGAVIPHVRDTLTSGMAENRPSMNDGLYRICYDFSEFTLSMIIGKLLVSLFQQTYADIHHIDCAYTSCERLKALTVDKDDEQMEIVLNDLLEVIQASNYFDLPELMSAATSAIGSNRLVQLETCQCSKLSTFIPLHII